MEVLTFDLAVSEIIPFDVNTFKSDSNYLWVWHADKIPPHIGISSQGKYFSLKSNGKDLNVPIQKGIELILRKSIKALLFELKADVSLLDLEEQFNSYASTIPNQVTCLDPLKNILQIPDARKLKDLLAELDASEGLGDVIGFNIDATFGGIQDYNIEDIHDRLRKLENA